MADIDSIISIHIIEILPFIQDLDQERYFPGSFLQKPILIPDSLNVHLLDMFPRVGSLSIYS